MSLHFYATKSRSDIGLRRLLPGTAIWSPGLSQLLSDPVVMKVSAEGSQPEIVSDSLRFRLEAFRPHGQSRKAMVLEITDWLPHQLSHAQAGERSDPAVPQEVEIAILETASWCLSGMGRSAQKAVSSGTMGWRLHWSLWNVWSLVVTVLRPWA